MCVTSWKGQNNTDFVATGSKDHYVKVKLTVDQPNGMEFHLFYFRFLKFHPTVA